MKLSDAEVDELFALVKANPGMNFNINMEAQEVESRKRRLSLSHDDAFRRHCMMNGLDSSWAYLAARRRHCRL
ncbi:hypothetical protein ACLK1T_07360 [Escherichia coli]